MRKLKLQVQMSVDGFIAGPNGEMDWLVWNWDDALKNYVTAITEPVDCIVLGRKLAQGFIPHWASVPEQEGAEKMNGTQGTQKVVFSKTLKSSDAEVMNWSNTVVNNGDLAEEIQHLKNKNGSDIIAYGGAGLVSSLLRLDLIDELHLFVNPAALGKGMRIFGELESNRPFRLLQSKAFDCGIVVLNYARKPEE